MKYIVYGVLILLAGSYNSVSAQAPDLQSMDIVTRSIPDGPVARVGKTSIEKIDFMLLYQSELNAYVEGNPDKKLNDGQRVRIALLCINILLEQELLYQESILKKITVEEAEVKRRANEQFDRLKEGFEKQAGRDVTEAEILERLGFEKRSEIDFEIKRSLLISAMRNKILIENEESLSDEIVQEFYQKNKDNMILPAGLHLKHISIRGAENNVAAREAGLKKINKALNNIYSGQLFDTVAQEYSELFDPERGCDLGMVPAGVLPPYMVKAAVNLEVGDVSDIVESETGLHIIQLVAKEKGGEVPEEKALDIVRARLVKERGRLLVREYCDRLILAGASVRVFLELEQNLARGGGKNLIGSE
jgi:parvulin-like peptidyl-prolyl isomerase